MPTQVAVLRTLVVTVVALALTIGSAPAWAAQKTFQDEANRTGTIDLRDITLKTTKKKLRIDLEMRQRIKTDLLRDREGGISMQFEADDSTNVIRVEYVVDAVGTVSVEVCDGFDGCVERKATIDGKHARFKMPLSQVKDGKLIKFFVFTSVIGGANQCPKKAGTCPDSYPNNGNLEQWRVG